MEKFHAVCRLRMRILHYKTVLLRERKKQATARRVAITPSVVLSHPIPGWGRGYPIPGWGVPHPWPRWVPPQKGHGTSGSILEWKWGKAHPPPPPCG